MRCTNPRTHSFTCPPRRWGIRVVFLADQSRGRCRPHTDGGTRRAFAAIAWREKATTLKESFEGRPETRVADVCFDVTRRYTLVARFEPRKGKRVSNVAAVVDFHSADHGRRLVAKTLGMARVDRIAQ